VPEGWGEPGEHPAAWWAEDRRAGSLGAQPGIQKGSTLPRRHRGPHLGAISRPRNEALPGQGRERFEVLVGAAVLANNLLRIAQMLQDGKPKRRAKAA